MHMQVSRDREYEIPTDFDPNLALAIIWGKDLAEARARGQEFLDNFSLAGENTGGEPLKSNITFLKRKTEKTLVF